MTTVDTKPEIFVIMTLPLGMDGLPLPSFEFQYTAVRCTRDTLKQTAAPYFAGMVNMGIFSMKMIDEIEAAMTGPGCVAIAAPPGRTTVEPADDYHYLLVNCDPKDLDAILDWWETEHGVKTLSIVGPDMTAAMRRAIAVIDVLYTRPLN